MVLGRELIADVEDIENDLLLETIDGIEPLMEKIIEVCKLKSCRQMQISIYSHRRNNAIFIE